MEDYQRRLINDFCVLRDRVVSLRNALNKEGFAEKVGDNHAVPEYATVLEDVVKEQGFDPRISRTDVITRAYIECMNEMYSKSQPSASYDGYVEKLRKGEMNREDKIYERHYLADEEFRYILDKYVDAYGMANKWNDYVDTVIDYLNDGATCDKWMKDEYDEEGNLVHPGYRSYEKLPSMAKIFTDIIKEEKKKGSSDTKIGEALIDAVKKRIQTCKEFYRFDREESDFHCSVALGASPTTNKETVKAYWKEHGVESMSEYVF